MVNADIKFAPKGTAGNSQFSIGDTSPKFDSNNVNYGFVNKSKKYDGHIIAVEYNSGSALLVNCLLYTSTPLLSDGFFYIIRQ